MGPVHAWKYRIFRVTVGAEVSERTQGGSEATASGGADTRRPARLQHYLQIPEELANRNKSPEERLPGGYLGSRARPSARRSNGDKPARVSAQLANSRTFAKLPRAGEPLRSGPYHRGPRGGSGRHLNSPAPENTRKSREKAGARGA